MIQFDEHIFQRGWFNYQLVLMLSQSRTHQHVGAVTHRQNIASLVLKKEQKNAVDLIHSEALLTRDIYIHIILQVLNHSNVNFCEERTHELTSPIRFSHHSQLSPEFVVRTPCGIRSESVNQRISGPWVCAKSSRHIRKRRDLDLGTLCLIWDLEGTW